MTTPRDASGLGTSDRPDRTGAAGDGGPVIPRPIEKYRTGIRGFDDLSEGGLPTGRVTAVIGGPGSGKTVFALQTLLHRWRGGGEPGIFVSFEEPSSRIERNIASFAWPMGGALSDGVHFMDARVPFDAGIGGAFDLTGLLAILGALVTETGARVVAFDGIDLLLTNLNDPHLEAREVQRIDAWLVELGISAIVTAKAFGTSERDQRRSDLLQYITDCVVLLDHSRTGTTQSRSLRIVKYRGSGFAANPAPLVIGRNGLDIVAVRASRTGYPTFGDRISSGIQRLDRLLAGGYLRGSSILISGSPGTSKTSLAANFVRASSEAGRTALFISFDESASQIIANMLSIGVDLQQHVASGTLVMESLLSRGRSPEENFLAIKTMIERHDPACLVIDPLSSLVRSDYAFADMTCEALLDIAKLRGITMLCTSLLDEATGDHEITESKISTIADTWLHVSYLAQAGERNRALTIIKSRGSNHSNQVRELVLGATGVRLVDAYIAEGQVLMGSAREQKEADARRQEAEVALKFERNRLAIERDVAELESSASAADRAITLKQKEAALLSAAETERLLREGEMARVRLLMRRSDDDTWKDGDAVETRTAGPSR